MIEWRELIGPALGGFIAALAGITVAIVNDHRQKKFMKSNIAKAFSCEIEDLENRIHPIIIEWQKWTKQIGFSGEKFSSSKPHDFFVELLHHPTIGPVLERNPIYDRDGEYFVFRKDISIYNQDLLSKLKKFYNYLLDANKNSNEFIKPSNTGYAREVLERFAYDFIINLESAYKLIPELKIDLKKYIID